VNQLKFLQTNYGLSASDVIDIIAGNEINLTSKNIRINSSNFSVDTNGNMTCNNADITGTVTGSTITGSSITNGNKFSVDANGNMNCSNVNITGGNISLKADYGNIRPAIEIRGERNQLAQYFSDYFGINSVVNDYPEIGIYAYFNEYEKYAVLQVYNTVNGVVNRTFINTEAVTTTQVIQTSKEEDKKNFEKLQSGLEILKDIDIYKYNLKSENDGTKKHLGFVIGDNYKYREEVTSAKHDGVDTYSFVSLCCQAIKEQQAIIEQMQKEIKEMKGEK
jgi:hypothetical protein